MLRDRVSRSQTELLRERVSKVVRYVALGRPCAERFHEIVREFFEVCVSDLFDITPPSDLELATFPCHFQLDVVTKARLGDGLQTM